VRPFQQERDALQRLDRLHPQTSSCRTPRFVARPQSPDRTLADVPPRRQPAARRLERGTGALATAAIARIEETLPWYAAMPAESRSWVNLVAQAGISAFVEWYRRPDRPLGISADVFGTAPRELTRTVTLQQTVELVRTTIQVVEERIGDLAGPGEEAALRDAVLRYSREIAFSAAQVYAEAAEARGAWDARLEALVVDALMRGEADEAIRTRRRRWAGSRTRRSRWWSAPRRTARPTT
jgi:hypothetical protein